MEPEGLSLHLQELMTGPLTLCYIL